MINGSQLVWNKDTKQVERHYGEVDVMANEFHDINDLIDKADNKNKEEQIKELEEQLSKMREDQKTKLDSSKQQLIDNLKITADKYMTATGSFEALRVLKETNIDDQTSNLSYYHAARLASHMNIVTWEIIHKVNDCEFNEMDSVLDYVYRHKFSQLHDDLSWHYDDADAHYQLAKELMILDLCRNVGPACEDIVAFLNRSDEEIEKTEEKLKELKSGK